MEQMVDLYQEARKLKGARFEEPVLYRYIHGKKKDGATGSKRVRIEILRTIIDKLGWKHKDKIRILAGASCFQMMKTEKEGYSLCLNKGSRGVVTFAVFNTMLPRNRQEIKEINVEDGVLSFNITPMEIKIPRD